MWFFMAYDKKIKNIKKLDREIQDFLFRLKRKALQEIAKQI